MVDVYPKAESPPACVSGFFNGEPQATKMEAMPELLADDATIEFIGPYAGPTTGMVLPREAILGGALPGLVASFPDFTFNPTKVPPVKGPDGGWWAKMQVTGTFTGAPFTPMPDKLPAVEPTNEGFLIGPEVFTVYPTEDGKIQKITVEAQYPGALVGPPGIYVAVGGTLG